MNSRLVQRLMERVRARAPAMMMIVARQALMGLLAVGLLLGLGAGAIYLPNVTQIVVVVITMSLLVWWCVALVDTIIRRQAMALERAKDSWVRRLRLAEAKSIGRATKKLAVTSGVICAIGFIGGFFGFLREAMPHLLVGVGTGTLFWLIVSYGDGWLRRIRVHKGWYGSNAMEVYELMQFIRETRKGDSDDSSPPRRFFEEDELTEGEKVNDGRSPDGVEGVL